MKRLNVSASVFALCLIGVFLGCNTQPAVELMDTQLISEQQSKLLLAEEPDGAIGIDGLHDLFADAPDDLSQTHDVVIVGRVGKHEDSDDPTNPKAMWSRDLAEFRIVDAAGEEPEIDESPEADQQTVDDEAASDSTDQNEDHDEDHQSGKSHSHDHSEADCDCPFCAADGNTVRTIVRFLGTNDEPIPIDARPLFQFNGEDLVVIQGKARREPGLFVIDGNGIYIRR